MLKNKIQEHLEAQERSILWLSEKIGRDYKGVHTTVTREDLSTTQLITVVSIASVLGVSVEDLYEISE